MPGGALQNVPINTRMNGKVITLSVAAGKSQRAYIHSGIIYARCVKTAICPAGKFCTLLIYTFRGITEVLYLANW